MASLEHLQEDVTPEELRRLLDEDAIDLIDVREPYEHEAGRIEGAIHDVFLSRSEPRAAAFAALDEWLDGYVVRS